MEYSAEFKPDAKRLRDTLAYIKAHPNEWEQDCWANTCGTSFCFAGHVVHKDREWEIVNTRDGEYDDDERPVVIPWPTVEEVENEAQPSWMTPLARNKKTGEIQEISDVAEVLLGTAYNSHWLFTGENTLPQLEGFVEDMIDGSVNEHGYAGRDSDGEKWETWAK